MESKPLEAGKLSAPPSEGAGSGGGLGPGGPPSTSKTPATTAASPFPRLPPLPSPSSSSSTGATAASSAQSRGGLALGVPAHHSTRPHQPFSSFGPSPPPSLQHQHQFLSSMHRGPDSSPSSTSQARSASPGVHNVGMFGSLGAGQLRASGAPASQPHRPSQAPIRSTPPPSSNPGFTQQQRMASQGMPRPPSSMAPPSGPTPPPSLSQQMQMHGPSSMPPPPASLFRPPQQRPPQTLQQTRPLYHGPKQHLQQSPQSMPFPPPRPSPFLQQTSRVSASGGMLPLGGEMGLTNLDAPDSGDKILTKKTIQELFSQIDPSEKLEPDVEDVIVEVAEDFFDSLTSFSCSLAKHRKSDTLDTKDVLLHAEKSWNITLPGFSGDEIKLYRKQNVNDTHRERLAMIKKSMGDQRSHAPRTTTALTSPQQQRP